MSISATASHIEIVSSVFVAINGSLVVCGEILSRFLSFRQQAGENISFDTVLLSTGENAFVSF